MELLVHHPRSEQTNQPERRQTTWQNKSALHVRLLAQKHYLNPNKVDLKADTGTVGDIFTRDYSLYGQISTTDRQQNHEDINSWINDVHEKLQLGHTFLTQTTDGQRWSHVFTALGINPTHLNQNQIIDFYQRYLGNENQGIKLKQFVIDLVNIHRDQAGNVNLDLLQQNQDVIRYIAAYFGTGQTIDTIHELVQAEARCSKDKNTLITEVNQPTSTQPNSPLRINQLTEEESGLLQYVWNHESTRESLSQESTPNPYQPPESAGLNGPYPERPSETSPSAVLTRETTRLLLSCNLKPEYMNAIPIGRGGNHTVYAYQEPGQPKQVVKLPNLTIMSAGMNNGILDEDANISVISQAFPGYVLPTETRTDPDSHRYCVLQQALEGEPLTNHNVTPEIKRQLADILTLNRRLYTQQKLALDMTGMPGIFSWIKRKIHGRNIPFELSNIMIDRHGKLKIIDYDLFKFNHDTTLNQKISAQVGSRVDRWLINHYFGLDTKRNN